MDAAAEATPLAIGAWTAVRGYFTPATLFLVLNLVIGTIALTSRSHQRRRREHHPHDYAHHQQPPPPPYQEPLGDPHHQQQQQEYHYYQYHQQQTQHAAPPLARTSSIMDRLRSIGLYRFRSGDFPPEYGAGNTASHDAFAPVVEEETTTTTTTELAAHYATSRSEPPAPVPAREVLLVKKAGTEVARGLLRQQEPSSPRKAEYQLQEEHVAPPPAPMRAPPPLSRTSSVLDRLRSLGLYSFLAAEQPGAATDPAVGENKQQAHAHYDRSRSEPAARAGQGKKEKARQQVAEARMGKSTSATARKPAAASSLLAEDCVDARAEAFIDSFRKEQTSQKQAVAVHHDEDDHAAVPPPPPPLARTSSVLDRLRSFSLYLRSVEDPVTVTQAPSAEEKTRQQAQYGRSRSEPAREQAKKKTRQQGAAAQQAKVSKTTSEVAARNRSAEESAAPPPADECVDARADDFINKFRQQLQLQRLNSLLSYKQQQQ